MATLAGDSDLESLVQLHVGAVGLWPRMSHSYLPELAEDDTQRRPGLVVIAVAVRGHSFGEFQYVSVLLNNRKSM